MDFSAFARLRPMMPVDALVQVAGDQWRAPDCASEGYVSFKAAGNDLACGARIDDRGRIGALSVYKSFPGTRPVEGLLPGMTLEAARRALPGWRRQEAADEEKYGIASYATELAGGDRIEARFKDDVLLGFTLERPGLRYPRRPYRDADPTLTTAFDLYCGGQRTLPRDDRDPAAWRNGWCFGLPPGIDGAQWPRCPTTGQPLRHAFTVFLPEQYRTQGMDLPALSLFVGPAHFEAAPVEGALPEPQPHPRKFMMTDVLDTHFAVLWHTRDAFEGTLAQPPAIDPGLAVPDWLHAGYDTLYGAVHGRPTDRDGKPHEWLPGCGLDTAFPIGVLEREGDPNVGKPAREWESQNEDSGYVTAFGDEGRALGLERFHGALAHLGGTLFPQQGYPDFSARVLEFEENFAGFNFGGGNAQLDLEQMRIDWACG